jgi:hypothetical protein
MHTQKPRSTQTWSTIQKPFINLIAQKMTFLRRSLDDTKHKITNHVSH